MSYVRRAISQRGSPSDPLWFWPWPTVEDGITTPPLDASASVATVTGRPYFYNVIGGGDDDFFNAFYNRVPQWTPFAGVGSPTLCHLSIAPGSTSGILGEPFDVDPDGGTDWTVISNVITETGDRSAYIFNEQSLPSIDPRFNDTSEQNYEYTRVIVLQNNTDTSAFVSLEYVFKVLGTETLRYGGRAYCAFVHHYKWSFTDDGGGPIVGGFISHYSENDGTGYGPHQMTTAIRLGERDFGNDHHMALSFTAYEYTSETMNHTGPTVTIASPIAALEINGVVRASDVWIQPVTSALMYFGFRFDNSDSASNLYDELTGHRTTDDDLPITMDKRLEN